MSARRLAPCWLLILAVSPGWTGSNPRTGSDLVVYLKAAPGQPAAPLEAMKRELAALMTSAGFRIEWRDQHSSNRNVEDAELIFVELRGACGLPANRSEERRVRKE